jgi:hypothetical protein
MVEASAWRSAIDVSLSTTSRLLPQTYLNSMLADCAQPSLRVVHVEREALGHSILPISLTITGENSKSNKIVNLGRVAAIPYYLTTLGA